MFEKRNSEVENQLFTCTSSCKCVKMPSTTWLLFSTISLNFKYGNYFVRCIYRQTYRRSTSASSLLIDGGWKL